MKSQKVLITGTAGFIGFHLANRLVREGFQVDGIDNINDYYDVNIKLDRLKYAGFDFSQLPEFGKWIQSSTYPNYRFIRANLEDRVAVEDIFKSGGYDYVIHLAAQAGVRYSLENPYAYIESNIIGTLNILEGCRHNPVKHLIYASSSSVYGANKKMPFSVHDNVDHPVALYAVSKKSNELMAHAYSNLFDIPSTGLRFFTVYGPWGRPDMALFLFTKAILEKKPINVFNHGKMIRDFTYVDDIVEAIIRLIPNHPAPNPEWSGMNPDPATSFSPYRIFNIGNSNPIQLMDFIFAIEEKLGVEAQKNMMPMQPGDVPETSSDVKDLYDLIGFQPSTSVKQGISNFIDWYRDYFKV